MSSDTAIIADMIVRTFMNILTDTIEKGSPPKRIQHTFNPKYISQVQEILSEIFPFEHEGIRYILQGHNLAEPGTITVFVIRLPRNLYRHR